MPGGGEDKGVVLGDWLRPPTLVQRVKPLGG